jgi:DNA mismatch repair ATPase MutL
MLVLGGAKIARLDRASRHQLEAEQVIVDVSSVLKELIENSLDAKAGSIGKLLAVHRGNRSYL